MGNQISHTNESKHKLLISEVLRHKCLDETAKTRNFKGISQKIAEASAQIQGENKPEPTYDGEFLEMLGRYYLLKELDGQHSFPIYLVKSPHSEEIAVLKTMSVEDSSFTSECNIFSLPRHKHVVHCKDVLRQISVKLRPESMRPKKEVLANAVVMEYMSSGDLFDYIAQGRLKESIARYYFEQITEAVDYLHTNDYCHPRS